MKHIVKVTIGNESIASVNSFTINQAFYEHHSFECSFYGDVIKGSAGATGIGKLRSWGGTPATGLEKYKGWLGKTIDINLDAGKLEFKGIICDVKYSLVGAAGTITLSGYSPTILLETTGGHYESYNNVTLQAVLGHVRAKIQGNSMAWTANALPGQNIKYLTQYNESYFSFLKRICSGCGCFLYYTGTTLHFGKLNPTAEVQLYLTDCTELEIGTQLVPLNFERYNYDYIRVSKEKKTPKSQRPGNPLLSDVYE